MDLKQARLLMGWTQSELAQKMGLSQPVINTWENGKVAIPSNRKQPLEELFGVPITTDKENNLMEIKNKAAFEAGRRRALEAIENKLAQARGEETNSTSQTITNQRFQAPVQRTARERIGFGSIEEGRQREVRAFTNALSASKVKCTTRLPGGTPDFASARDHFDIPSPADQRRAFENSRAASAELTRIHQENQAAARRRLGFGNKKSALVERLSQLLDEE